MLPPRPTKPESLRAPGLNWRPRAHSWVALWIARGDLVERGYSLKSVRLWPPSTDTTRPEPTPEEWLTIGAACDRLQSEMLEWANPSGRAYDPRDVYDGTLKSLDLIYRTDPDSSYQELRIGPKQSYDSKSRTLCATVGDARIPQLTFRDFKRWHEGFCQPKKPNGARRKSRGHALMTHVRIVIGFGSKLRLPGCKEARELLSEMEFEVPKRRKEFMTPEYAIAICRQAHIDGCPSIAMAQALMFDLGVRQTDAIGQWVPQSEPGLTTVTDHGDKWIIGMTWEKFNNGTLTQQLSKSLRRADLQDATAGKIKRYDLSLYSLVRAEIAHVPLDKRAGPMVVAEHTGLPWRAKVFQRRWRKIATAAGVPRNIQNRDSRPGAASEAENLGADIEMIRKSLGHSQAVTTQIYMRDEDAATAKVAILRAKNRPQTE